TSHRRRAPAQRRRFAPPRLRPPAGEAWAAERLNGARPRCHSRRGRALPRPLRLARALSFASSFAAREPCCQRSGETSLTHLSLCLLNRVLDPVEEGKPPVEIE